MNRIYACVDLKSFYASVECVERGLDPITTNLVVADSSRTEKTICLAVTPSLKQYGIPGRARLFEVIQKVGEINRERKKKIDGRFLKKSIYSFELEKNPRYELDFLIATPRMRLYMKYSTNIYRIYLKYLAPEDVFVYSIDEVFCDITDYLKLSLKSAEEFLTMILLDIYETTGITATAGIGTNMYLAKIAMDIVAKKKEPNEQGVRIAYLDEELYRKKLWSHVPLTDFWRVGVGTMNRLSKMKLYTMGDVAKKSLEDEDALFRMFGVNAELLIDHAWGWEPCTMREVKKYRPSTTSLSSSQVLPEPYKYEKTRLIVKEMTELITLDMIQKGFVTDTIVLTIGYDKENLEMDDVYTGAIVKDHYGREIPKHAHGTVRIDHKTASTSVIMREVLKLFNRIVNPSLTTRRVSIAVCGLCKESEVSQKTIEQLDLFSMDDVRRGEKALIREKEEARVQKSILEIQHKYGKNAILKGMNLEKGATTIERNSQVGGHRG